jgi:KUP system potassium uptake protein
MHGGYIAVLIALSILSVMYIWIKGHYIKMHLLENVPLEDYVHQLNQLRKDAERPKYASNLVYLTSCEDAGYVEKKIMYSILDKRPKKADVYWFVNITVADEPYIAEYSVDTLDTNYIVKVQLNLGFRVQQKLNVFLRQISTELVDSNEIQMQSRNYTTMPYRKVGDFRFILIQEHISCNSELNWYERFILKFKLFIKKYIISPEKWFGLETSDVEIENVPLFSISSKNVILTRTEKNSTLNKKEA